MKHIITLAFLCVLCITSAAQPKYDLRVEWDNVYPDRYPEIMHDFIMLDDGRVAVVGETEGPGQKKDGFFALFEAGTFRRILHKTFGQFRDDVLTGVAYADDFSFYLVGYTETGDQGRQAWALKIEEETGDIIFEKQLGGPGDQQFDKIVWLPEADHGLISGRNETPGYLWLAKVDGNEVTPLQNGVGDGIIGELVGMEKGPNCVWLCGYTRRVKNYTKSGDVWVIKLNPEGMLSESIRKISAKAGQEVFGLTGTMDGELYLAGKVGNANGDSDVWLAEIRPGERDPKPLSFGSDIQDCATSLFRTPGHFKWLVVRKLESKELTVQVYSDTIDHNYSAYEVTRNEDFHVNRILNISDNLYLLAGTSYAGSRSEGRIRLLCLRANETLRPKDPPQITEQNIRFDDNGDGKLNPGESGALRFALKNTSPNVPILKGSIQIRLVAGLPGVTVALAPRNLGELPVGAEKTFSIAVKADKTLPPGQIILEISVEANDRAIRTFQAVITAEHASAPASGQPVAQADLSVTEPDMAGRNSRIIIATEPKTNVTVRAFSGNQNLKSTDFKTRVNGQLRQDDKSPVNMTMIPRQKSNRFEYVFKQELTLKKGRNVVYFELEGERTDSIIFEFTPEKPNLHLLVIGVPQKDLKYTVKDARDFAAAMIGQRGVGFFNEVFADTLTTKEKTTAPEITKAFARLEREYRINKRIKRNDYVVVFMSSHGIERKKDEAFGLLASDYEPDFEDLTTISYADMVEKYLNLIDCKKVIFIDACHSGTTKTVEKVEGSKADPGALERLADRIKAANAVTNGAATYFSCKAEQSSYEDNSWKNGAFTEAILEAFAGQTVMLPQNVALEADKGDPSFSGDSLTHDGFIAIGELDVFLQQRVPSMVKQKGPTVEQNPQFEIKTPMTRDITIFQIIK